MEAQLQYNFDLPALFDSEWTFGWDYRDTASDSEYTLYGRNDDDDKYTICLLYTSPSPRDRH